MHRMYCTLFITIASLLLAPSATGETAANGVIIVTGIASDARGGFVTRSAKVDLSDLDVNKVDTAPIILSRLRHAADSVCKANYAIDRMLAEKLQKCRTKAVAEAIAMLDKPEVTRLASEQ